jgi:hypothetical protein
VPTTCPKCGGVIPQDDVNVAKDIAFCRKCDKGFALSDLISDHAIPNVDLANPPRGAWYRDDGGAVSIGASLRSAGGALGVLLFAGFWNFVSWTIFIAMLKGSAKVSGPGIHHSDGKTTVDAFAFLFITPFLLIGAVAALLVVFMLVGRVEVVIRGQEGSIFTGAGAIGRRLLFDPASVTGVALRPANWTKNNQPQFAICLDGPSLKFGSALPEPKRQFIAAALRKVLG